MLAVLPLACFILLYIIFDHNPASSRRLALIKAALTWGVLVTAILEGLSAVTLITRWAVASSWLLCILGLVYAIVRQGPRHREDYPSTPPLLAPEWLIAILLLAIAVTVGYTALASPPNSFDAMTYHMSRVMHWVQNRSLRFYPTPILRQLHQCPWAEYAITHWQLLTGADYLANSVQWASFCGSVIAVSLIARELGGERLVQLVSGLVAATIPMGVLQASGAQTDCAASLWCCSLVLFILQSRDDPGWENTLFLGASAALAALTKATTGLFALSFIAWYALAIKGLPLWRSIPRIAAILALVALVNAPQAARNCALYGGPLGPGHEGTEGRYKYTNDVFSPAVLASNTVRNLALHMVTVPALDRPIEHAIGDLHDHLDLDPSDPRTTWTWTSFGMNGLSLHEGAAGNPLHLLLGIGAILASLCIKRLRRLPGLLLYSACCVLGFLAFCLLLRWQPWNSRLHLPLFFLVSPIVGITSVLLSKRLGTGAAILLTMAALPYLLFNPTRALATVPPDWVNSFSALKALAPSRTVFNTPRWIRYFNDQQTQDSYSEVVEYIVAQGCAEVGLYLGMNDWEYPYWALLRSRGMDHLCIRHVGVSNVSATFYSEPVFGEYQPDLVLVRQPGDLTELEWNGNYRLALWAPHSAVFERERVPRAE